jgi:hypothetical protein
MQDEAAKLMDALVTPQPVDLGSLKTSWQLRRAEK